MSDALALATIRLAEILHEMRDEQTAYQYHIDKLAPVMFAQLVACKNQQVDLGTLERYCERAATGEKE